MMAQDGKSTIGSEILSLRLSFWTATNPYKLSESVNHGRGEYARDEDGDGFCEVHVNPMEGFWSLLRS